MTLRTSPRRPAETGWAVRFGGLIIGLALGMSLASAEPTYTVKKGDNLWRIAKQFQVSVTALQEANHLAPDTPLKIGLTLIIPPRTPAGKTTAAVAAVAPPSPAAQGTSSHYVVQPGDYVLKIARKLGVSSQSFLAANDLDESALLQIGQKLVIPSGAKPPAVAGPRQPEASPSASTRAKETPPARKNLPAVVYASEPRVHLRRGPGTSHPSLTKVAEGARLKVLARAGQWWKVANPRGGEAYVAGWVVSSTASPTAPQASGPRAVVEVVAAPATAAERNATEASSADLPAVVYANESQVRMRQGPGTSHPCVSKVARGTALKVLSKVDDWWKVKTPSGQPAYVASWVVTTRQPTSSPSPTPQRRGFILEARVPVREAPSTEADTVAYAARGSQVLITQESEDWYRVRFDNGTQGWVASWKVRTNRLARDAAQPSGKEEVSVPATASALSQSLVRTALKHQGSPYRYGGTTSRGFDCSGLMCAIFRSHGISLPRTSRAMSKTGQAVARSQLQPGDLVFFNTNGRGVSHVGMYIGNNKFIHASTRRTGVLVSNLGDKYYRQRYVSARRVSR